VLFNQDQFFSTFYLNKWDLNNSYLDNQQLFEANSKSSEPLHKKLMGFFSDFENTLAELVQMKEKLYQTLKKSVYKTKLVYKQQEDIPSFSTTIFNTLVHKLYSIFSTDIYFK
jgi:hypothetical protein